MRIQNYHTATQLITQQCTALLCCVSFFYFLQLTTRDSKSHKHEPNIDLYFVQFMYTCTTDVEYTHENDKKNGSDECPNVVSIISQPTPVIHRILHFQVF